MKNVFAAIAVFACLAVKANTIVVHTPGLVEGTIRGVAGAATCIGEFAKGVIVGSDTVVTTSGTGTVRRVVVNPVPTAGYVVASPAVVAPTVVAPVTPVYVRPYHYSRYGCFYRDYYYGIPPRSCRCYY